MTTDATSGAEGFATKRRNPVERLFVWGLIAALAVTAILQWRARHGYEATLTALQTAIARSEQGDPLKLSEAERLMHGTPARLRERQRISQTFSYRWRGVYRDYWINLQTESDLASDPVVLGLETNPHETRTTPAELERQDSLHRAVLETPGDLEAALRKTLADVYYDDRGEIIGIEFNVRSVDRQTAGITITDAALAHLGELESLQVLEVGGTHVTDKGLARLKKLKNLRSLAIDATHVTDDGLKYVSGFPNLEVLRLSDTQITDAGLDHLQNLKKLRLLTLFNTQITNAGVEKLAVFTDLEELGLGGTRITDEGLILLKQFKKLRKLAVGQSQITNAGLAHLESLSQLQFLAMHGSQITPTGADRFHAAVPHCVFQY